MSWANQQGSGIDSPRRPRCRQTDALLAWTREASGAKRRARHRAYRAWLLCRVGGLSIVEVVAAESSSLDTIRNRLAAVDCVIASDPIDM